MSHPCHVATTPIERVASCSKSLRSREVSGENARGRLVDQIAELFDPTPDTMRAPSSCHADEPAVHAVRFDACFALVAGADVRGPAAVASERPQDDDHDDRSRHRGEHASGGFEPVMPVRPLIERKLCTRRIRRSM